MERKNCCDLVELKDVLANDPAYVEGVDHFLLFNFNNELQADVAFQLVDRFVNLLMGKFCDFVALNPKRLSEEWIKQDFMNPFFNDTEFNEFVYELVDMDALNCWSLKNNFIRIGYAILEKFINSKEYKDLKVPFEQVMAGKNKVIEEVLAEVSMDLQKMGKSERTS